jgi:capsular exopolysaccharide synthesis family protein
MSKIYEALRQAELDRSKPGSTPAENGPKSPTSGQALLEMEQERKVSNLRSTVTIPPVTNATAGKDAATYAFEPAIGTNGAGPAGLDSSLDLTKVRCVVWSPSRAQLPALDERGSAIEQFRSLRSRMQEFRDLNTLKALLVSSGLPQEGKSFVAANLALSFARHKAGRVLLIDGDMRRATLYKMLGAPQGPGLTEYLAGDASIVDVMQRPVTDNPDQPLPIGLASITFIPAGTEHDKAADLSGNRRFDELIKAVSPHFDWIVVDSSPVNLVSDGVNLARACDAVLLVARCGVTKYPVTQRAIAELKASKVLGLVLNAVKNPPVSGGYYGYDGYDKIEE